MQRRVTALFEVSMLLLTRSEFENAASALGFRSATLRQWRHRRTIPAAAKLRMTIFFDQPFEIIDAPEPQPSTKSPRGSTLASLAARYIR
jgi:hypothetical protein